MRRRFGSRIKVRLQRWLGVEADRRMWDDRQYAISVRLNKAEQRILELEKQNEALASRVDALEATKTRKYFRWF